MKFQIVTPSYNQLSYLRRAVASVRDQACDGIGIHHHVQDAGSTDGTVDWLREQGAEDRTGVRDAGCGMRGSRCRMRDAKENRSKSLKGVENGAAPLVESRSKSLKVVQNRSESMELSGAGCGLQRLGEYQLGFASGRDEGMYDALSKGFAVAKGLESDVCAYLNCDEQYLEGTLRFVAEYFKKHPETDILFGDSLIVDAHGSLLAFRKGYSMRKAYVQADHLYNLSCAMFFRREVWEEVGFDPALNDVGDEDFVTRALEAGYKARHVPRYLSVFTFTRDNRSLGVVARKESQVLKRRAPLWIRTTSPLINLVRRFEKFCSGAYSQQFPLHYDIYTDDLSARDEFVAEASTPKWPG